MFSPRIETLSRMKEATRNENIFDETRQVEINDSRKRFIGLFGIIGRLSPNSGYVTKKRKKLMQAAVLMKPEEFIGISFISALLIVGIIFLITKSMVALASGPIGYIIPDVLLGMKKSKRMVKLNAQLPEAVNIISNGLRVGFSFTQAMAVVTKELEGPIRDEFNKVLRDNSYGKPFEEALISMSERTDDEDLDMIITALIIQRQVGGNLANVLDTISNTIRERVRIKGEVKTLTAQGRVSGVVVSLLPLGLAFAFTIISPGYLDILFTTTIGKLMILVGVILQLTGIFVLTKLVDVKV